MMNAYQNLYPEPIVGRWSNGKTSIYSGRYDRDFVTFLYYKEYESMGRKRGMNEPDHFDSYEPNDVDERTTTVHGVAATKIRRTDLAIHVEIHNVPSNRALGFKRFGKIWIPLSQIDKLIQNGEELLLDIKMWVLEKANFI